MTDYRAALLEWAKTQVGPGDRAAYWRSAFGSDPGSELAWCGVFCLAGLHAIGLAQDVRWHLGLGFVGPAGLKQTKTPERGDIGYVSEPYQHHFLYDHTDDRGLIHSIDGNQPDVRERTRRPDQVTCFYSIAGLIPLPEAGFLRGEKYSVSGIQDKPGGDDERTS